MPFSRTPFDDFMDQQCVLTNGKSFYARLAGSGFPNSDGSSRQAALSTLGSTDELKLIPEPDNEQDTNAIRVVTQHGLQVGYMEQRLAGETTRRTRKGQTTRAFVSNLTGGSRGQIFGCTMAILVY